MSDTTKQNKAQNLIDLQNPITHKEMMNGNNIHQHNSTTTATTYRSGIGSYSPSSSSNNTNNTSCGPCGACKFLRRKCVKGCIFAPYFDADQGTAHFAAVHKVFGASNASKLLLRIPPNKRLDAVVTLSYEALARIRDPVYGCVSHIFTLQQQVVNLQAELAYVQARLSTLQGLPATLPQHQSPSPTSMHSSSDTVVSASDLALSTSNILMHLDPVQPQASSELTSFVSPFDQEFHDGELQVLGRQFVSRYLPAALRFRSSGSH